MDKFRIASSKYQLREKLKTGDPRWRDFNASFVNVEGTMKQILGAIYNGRAMTTQHKNNWRSTENYICGQHIGLDFDTEDQASTLDHLQKDKFIAKYAGIIHTTPSHTQDKPRARVLFFLDTPIMQAKNYSAAAAAMVWSYGQSDQKCKDAARFFYGAWHCDYVMIGNVLPISIVKNMIASHNQSQRPKRKTYNHTPADQKEVQAALRMINPWAIDYDDWVNVLMGIHSEFGDAGLPLAEAWASGKNGEVAQKFRSFKEDGNPAGKVTIATVFGIAKQFGWTKNENLV